MPDWLLDLFTRYGYGAVFAGVLLEGTGVPVPGETVLLGGAVLAHLGRLSLGGVIGAAIAGALTGDNLGFLIGRRGGRTLVERYGSRVGLSGPRLARFDGFFNRYGARTIFFARFVTGLRVVCAVMAGGSELPWRIFAAYNAAGVVAWSTAVGCAGYLLGESWDRIERWVGRSALVMLALVLAAGVFVALRSRRERTS